jgi:hypothetical protein
MATCPRCMGPLTDDHRCPRAQSRRLLGVGAPILVGVFVGVMACFGLFERPHPMVVLFAGLLGGLLADALRRAVVPRV